MHSWEKRIKNPTPDPLRPNDYSISGAGLQLQFSLYVHRAQSISMEISASAVFLLVEFCTIPATPTVLL